MRRFDITPRRATPKGHNPFISCTAPRQEESGMGRRGYPPEFRRKVLDLIDADRSVADVARDLGISDQSIYTWRRQDRVDRGLVPDLTSTEKAELVAAKRRIAQLPAPLV